MNSRSARVTPGNAMRVGATPKRRRSAFLGGPGRSLGGVLCRRFQTCFGRNRDPNGALLAKQKTECRRASHRPRSSDRARDGMEPGRLASERNLSAFRRCHQPANQIHVSRQTSGQRATFRTPCCRLHVRCGHAQVRTGWGDSVCDTVLKKAVHGRASDLRFHLLDHAASAEETR